MQSFFRLPWSTDPAGDKALMDTMAYHYPAHHHAAGVVDMSLLNKAKRKRLDNFESPARSAPQPKKLKAPVTGGAVQPVVAFAPARGPDAYALQLPAGHVDGGRRVAGDAPSGRLPGQPLVAATPAEEPLKSQLQFAISSTPAEPATPTVKADDSVEFAPEPVARETVDMSVDANLDHVRSVIGAQFDLEILLKHNELRLIEQELAKCQVALEQLRRCELIPFPGSQAISQNVAAGVGPSLKSRSGYTTPAQPAPYGVTDGPYTRHYAQWLIHDPMFDSMAQTSPGFSVSTPLHDRATRRSGGDVLTSAVSARSSRFSGAGKSDLVREQPQQWRDPLVLKRQSDGQWVKLICTKCQPERSNFQNVQGFLNHCRISHKDFYESHEAAAVACGRAVEVDESYTSAPPTATQSRKPTQSFLDPVIVKTPLTASPLPFEKPVINNLVRPVKPCSGQTNRKSMVLPRMAYVPSLASGPTTPTVESPASIVASPQTPYLSALLLKRNIACDLEAAVAATKRKIDTSLYDCSESDTDQTTSKSKKQKKGSQAKQPKQLKESTSPDKKGVASQSHQPKHPVVAAQHPTSDSSTRRPSVTLSTLAASSVRSRIEIPDSPPTVSERDEMELSPGTAVESNPGLVSDHDDDDDDADEDAMVVEPTVHVHPHHRASATGPGGLGAGLGVSGGPTESCRSVLAEIDGFAFEIEDSEGEGREGAKRVRLGGRGAC